MQSTVLTLTLLLAVGPSVVCAQSNNRQDGMVHTDASGVQQAWDAQRKQWLTLEDFWLSYADRRGGLSWGRRSDYPRYSEVKELDTMIIELESGSCMMMFFHTRWRRANDVRRWDDAFNRYSACPYVFD